MSKRRRRWGRLRTHLEKLDFLRGFQVAHGGTRPGSGRKAKVTTYRGPVAEAEHKIKDRLPWIVDRLFELAEGVQVEQQTPTGAPVVYQRRPDRAACEYLMDRIMGKPTQPVEIRERAQRVADMLGVDVREVIAEAERIAAGKA